MNPQNEISPSTQFLLDEIRKLFDKFEARWDARWGNQDAMREASHGDPVPSESAAAGADVLVADNWGGFFDGGDVSSEQHRAASSIVADNWGGLFDQAASILEEPAASDATEQQQYTRGRAPASCDDISSAIHTDVLARPARLVRLESTTLQEFAALPPSAFESPHSASEDFVSTMFDAACLSPTVDVRLLQTGEDEIPNNLDRDNSDMAEELTMSGVAAAAALDNDVVDSDITIPASTKCSTNCLGVDICVLALSHTSIWSPSMLASASSSTPATSTSSATLFAAGRSSAAVHRRHRSHHHARLRPRRQESEAPGTRVRPGRARLRRQQRSLTVPRPQAPLWRYAHKVIPRAAHPKLLTSPAWQNAVSVATAAKLSMVPVDLISVTVSRKITSLSFQTSVDPNREEQSMLQSKNYEADWSILKSGKTARAHGGLIRVIVVGGILHSSLSFRHDSCSQRNLQVEFEMAPAEVHAHTPSMSVQGAVHHFLAFAAIPCDSSPPGKMVSFRCQKRKIYSAVVAYIKMLSNIHFGDYWVIILHIFKDWVDMQVWHELVMIDASEWEMILGGKSLLHCIGPVQNIPQLFSSSALVSMQLQAMCGVHKLVACTKKYTSVSQEVNQACTTNVIHAVAMPRPVTITSLDFPKPVQPLPLVVIVVATKHSATSFGSLLLEEISSRYATTILSVLEVCFALLHRPGSEQVLELSSVVDKRPWPPPRQASYTLLVNAIQLCCSIGSSFCMGWLSAQYWLPWYPYVLFEIRTSWACMQIVDGSVVQRFIIGTVTSGTYTSGWCTRHSSLLRHKQEHMISTLFELPLHDLLLPMLSNMPVLVPLPLSFFDMVNDDTINWCCCWPWKPPWSWKHQCLPSVPRLISDDVDLGATTWQLSYFCLIAAVASEGFSIIVTASRKSQTCPCLLAARQELCGVVHGSMQLCGHVMSCAKTTSTASTLNVSVWCYCLLLESPWQFLFSAPQFCKCAYVAVASMIYTVLMCNEIDLENKNSSFPWDPGGSKFLHQLGGKPKLKKGGMHGWAVIWPASSAQSSLYLGVGYKSKSGGIEKASNIRTTNRYRLLTSYHV